MTQSVIVHITNEDPIVGELDALPGPTDTLVTLHNPRRRDGKDIPYLTADVVTVIWPIDQITYIEVIPLEGEETIIGFVRD